MSLVHVTPNDKIIMALDGADWHSSGLLKSARNIKLLLLPPYTPELNPVGHMWDELREKHFYNCVFNNLGARENQLERPLHTFKNNAPMVKSHCGLGMDFSALLN
jgi:transposase